MRASELTEARASDDILYHFTNIHSAAEILQNDSIRLTPDTSNKSDQALRKTKDKPFYLSLTRHKLGAYHKGHKSGVILNLNGSLLANNYSMKPVDYWGDFWYPDEKARSEKHEGEDRLFSNKSRIGNAKAYITSVHCVGSYDNDREKKRLRAIALNAKRLGIPFFFYQEQKNWLLQKNPSPLPVTDLKSIEEPEQKFPDYPRGRYLKPYIELLMKPPGSPLSKEGKRRLGSIHYSDAHSSLEADLHNDKKSKDAATLAKLMQKMNLPTAKHVTDHILDRWTETDENGYTSWLG